MAPAAGNVIVHLLAPGARLNINKEGLAIYLVISGNCLF
jgi:hypothetical protein